MRLAFPSLVAECRRLFLFLKSTYRCQLLAMRIRCNIGQSLIVTHIRRSRFRYREPGCAEPCHSTRKGRREAALLQSDRKAQQNHQAARYYGSFERVPKLFIHVPARASTARGQHSLFADPKTFLRCSMQSPSDESQDRGLLNNHRAALRLT